MIEVVRKNIRNAKKIWSRCSPTLYTPRLGKLAGVSNSRLTRSAKAILKDAKKVLRARESIDINKKQMMDLVKECLQIADVLIFLLLCTQIRKSYFFDTKLSIDL
jgi:hypothetical protein